MNRGLICSKTLALSLLLGILATGTFSKGTEIRWRPVDATGNVVCLPEEGTCGPTEIRLSGGNVNVTMFMEVADWDPENDGWPLLGGFQGALDATTFEGGLLANVAYVGHPGNPGTTVGCDLIPNEYVPGSTDCTPAAWQALKVCQADYLDPESIDWLSRCQNHSDCTGPLPFCLDRPDWVFFGIENTPTVACATYDYTWGAATTVCREDNETYPYFYGGTLVVSVPECATGRYNVSFVDNVNFTLFNDCAGNLIQPQPIVSPGQITILGNRCCYGIGTDLPGCVEGISQAECDAMPPLAIFESGASCADPCPECVSDDDCNDPTPAQDPGADNLCTNDTCEDGVCVYTKNYPDALRCCDPNVGPPDGLTQINDFNDCTVDTCDEDTGIVTHVGDCDSDFVCDDEDNCPTVANASQDDADEDGYGDVCDGPFDADHDGDIDLADLSEFVGCLSGPTTAATAECEDIHDTNGDSGVDLHEVSQFQRVYTGEVPYPCDYYPLR